MQTANEDQAEYWGNSESGTKWLTFEDKLDHMLAPVLDLVLERADLTPGLRVLDIGCGTGAGTVAAARAVGPDGHVLGADISAPFLDRARQRARDLGLSNAAFRLADAQVTPFAPETRDEAISRFGVMFFGDPVAAFANIAKALVPGGRMTFAARGPLSDNPWFRVPHVAATTHLGQPPKYGKYAPGPLAFHDIDHVVGLMNAAGLTDITADRVALHLPGLRDVAETADLCTRVGPAGRVIAHFDGSEIDFGVIRQAVQDAFEGFVADGKVAIPAVINLYQARRAA
ncbi:methyltransferase, UbiE/COQ5 family [Ruegeria lacuscaerulensis ITI-1157]|nr:methyltransferase, UbiE/COQ5 family [Ruegeria lacuscaerulensis ITI-1157]SHI71851.1 Methyltransferase domain-containing protein [Ruegeria lacuscaerulensis ITI-1157]